MAFIGLSPVFGRFWYSGIQNIDCDCNQSIPEEKTGIVDFVEYQPLYLGCKYQITSSHNCKMSHNYWCAENRSLKIQIQKNDTCLEIKDRTLTVQGCHQDLAIVHNDRRGADATKLDQSKKLI